MEQRRLFLAVVTMVLAFADFACAQNAGKPAGFGAVQTKGRFEIAIDRVYQGSWDLPAGSFTPSEEGFVVFLRCKNTGAERDSLLIPVEKLTLVRADNTTAVVRIDHAFVGLTLVESFLAKNSAALQRQLQVKGANGKTAHRWSFGDSTADLNSGKYFGRLEAGDEGWTVTLDGGKQLILPLVFYKQSAAATELRWPGIQPFSLVKPK